MLLATRAPTPPPLHSERYVQGGLDCTEGPRTLPSYGLILQIILAPPNECYKHIIAKEGGLIEYWD